MKLTELLNNTDITYPYPNEDNNRFPMQVWKELQDSSVRCALEQKSSEHGIELMIALIKEGKISLTLENLLDQFFREWIANGTGRVHQVARKYEGINNLIDTLGGNEDGSREKETVEDNKAAITVTDDNRKDFDYLILSVLQASELNDEFGELPDAIASTETEHDCSNSLSDLSDLLGS